MSSCVYSKYVYNHIDSDWWRHCFITILWRSHCAVRTLWFFCSRNAVKVSLYCYDIHTILFHYTSICTIELRIPTRSSIIPRQREFLDILSQSSFNFVILRSLRIRGQKTKMEGEGGQNHSTLFCLPFRG